MKILLFTEASSAGVGRHVIDLAEGLNFRDNECHLLYGIARMDRRFALRVAQLPQAIALPVQKNPSWSDLRILLRLRRYIKLHGPFEILHAHSTKAGLLLRLAAIGCRGSVLYTPHAPLTMNPRLPAAVRILLAFFEVVLALLTTRLIAVSLEEADHLTTCGVPPQKISVVSNGIEERTPPAPGKAQVLGSVRIGFLGRLSSQKNVGLLLDAFASAFRKEDSASLVIGGTGPELGILQAKAEALAIGNRVTWLGACTADAINEFDIFAIPSAYEGMPYVLLEALSAGIPVVATAVGGVRSVVSDGVEGFVVQPGATIQFAAALRKLATNEALRKSFGRQAAIRASQFPLSRMIAETVSVYQESICTVKRATVGVRTSAAAGD